MRIKGTSKPVCSLCRFSTSKDKTIVCELTHEETSDKNSCKEFKYDIFKYKPSSKADFGKFSKEDFEI